MAKIVCPFPAGHVELKYGQGTKEKITTELEWSPT